MRHDRAALAAVAAAVLLAGCAGGAQSPEQSPSARESPIDRVIERNFPDPDVIEVDGTYYAYATEDNARNVQAARSTDLVEWELLPDVLPELPSWIIPGKTWAPEVTEVQPGRFVMYFTATNFQPSF